jgi:hypothetical protein
VRALLERDRGQDVVTVCGVVRHASSPSSSTRRDSPTATHPLQRARLRFPRRRTAGQCAIDSKSPKDAFGCVPVMPPKQRVAEMTLHDVVTRCRSFTRKPCPLVPTATSKGNRRDKMLEISSPAACGCMAAARVTRVSLRRFTTCRTACPDKAPGSRHRLLLPRATRHEPDDPPQTWR